MLLYRDRTEDLSLGMSAEQMAYHLRLGRSMMLSQREREAMEHIKSCKGTQDIANLMYLTRDQARRQICALYIKLGINERVAVAGLGLAPPPSEKVQAAVCGHRSGQAKHFVIMKPAPQGGPSVWVLQPNRGRP